MQSVLFTTSITWQGVLDTTLCDKVCQWLVAGQWFSSSTPVSSTNKTCPPRCNWNIAESGVKHHKPNPNELNISGECTQISIEFLGITISHVSPSRCSKFDIIILVICIDDEERSYYWASYWQMFKEGSTCRLV